MNFLLSGLTLYIWGVVAVLIVLLNRIARFYQITSGRKSYYQLFWVPLVCISLGAVRYATQGVLTGDVLGDGLMLLGGVLLIGLGYYLLKLMTGSRS
jgi:hypothetical protein